MNDDGVAPALFIVAMFAVVVARLYREWWDSHYSETELADWNRWAKSTGLNLEGGYPSFGLRGTIDGVVVSLRHDVEYGAKGSKKYSVRAFAITDRSTDLSVVRVGILSRLLGARAVPVPVGSGEVSIAAPLPEVGRLSPSGAGTGALSEPGGRPVEEQLELPVPADLVEVDADFARAFDVTPRDAVIPPKVKLALLSDSSLGIEAGKVSFARNSLARCAEARRIVATLVQIAKALRSSGS